MAINTIFMRKVDLDVKQDDMVVQTLYRVVEYIYEED